MHTNIQLLQSKISNSAIELPEMVTVSLWTRISREAPKKWTFHSYIQTEILRRALRWSRLIPDTGHIAADLNLTISHRISEGLDLVVG